MKKDQSSEIISLLSKFYGEVFPSLVFSNNYELTISVVLSAQTTDAQVNKVTPNLFKNYPDFSSLSKAKIDKVEKIIRSTGFFRNKAKNIIKLSQMIFEKYNGEIPGSIDELVNLPGVGRKTANVILAQGFDRQTIAVDTHVARISRRLGFTDSEKPLAIEKDLMRQIPETQWRKINLLFIMHGREKCRARCPLCRECPVRNLCYSSDKIP